MSVFLDTIYNMLGLTADQQSVVNSALPAIKDVLDAADANLDVIDNIEHIQTKHQLLIKDLVADWKIIGPNLSAAAVDGSVDFFATINAYNDIKTKLAANPDVMPALQVIYNQLAPVIMKVISDWPKIEPAVNVIMGGVAAKGGLDIRAIQSVKG